jgi:phosphatidylglycerol lysyltransferase
MLAVLGPRIGAAEVASALVLYRLVYVVVPLIAAGLITAAQTLKLEAANRRAIGESRVVRAAEAVWREAAPMTFGLLTFAAGVVMLVSVATPDAASRLKLLSALAPAGLVDASHFLASLAGVVLLFLAFGVMGRLRRAYLSTLAALVAAALATLAKGFNYEEAIFLVAVAGLLFLSRSAFYRTTTVRSAPLSPGAVAGILVALAAAAWLGLFAHQHVAYRDELWWTFVTDQTAPRFLRASVGAAALTVALIAWRLTSPRPVAAALPTSAELDLAAVALEHAEGATLDANLVFMGDKSLMFSPSGQSFIQYASRGGAWIAMGEPVGPRAERNTMIWAFRDLADRHGVHPVFYAVERDSVADFVDCGLVASKIGETAVVELADFSLEGSRRASLRQAYNRGQREGVVFEIAPSEAFDALEPQLRAVSDQWLAIHHGEEKSFSLGRFDPAYLRRFPTALMRVGEEVVAFANLWRTPEGKSLSIDLMRYGAGAPKNIMDMLFVHLRLWGKGEGYAEFNLGMAPLSGLDPHRLARAVTRLGALVYAEGGEVYGFEGLRTFKNKFGPRWDATYIAAPSGWMLASALGDVALLSSGGLKGLLK